MRLVFLNLFIYQQFFYQIFLIRQLSLFHFQRNIELKKDHY
jgi:hypothetical protein